MMSDDSSRASRSRAAKRIAFLLVTAVCAQFCRAAESAPQELSPQEEQAALWKAETTGLPSTSMIIRPRSPQTRCSLWAFSNVLASTDFYFSRVDSNHPTRGIKSAVQQ